MLLKTRKKGAIISFLISIAVEMVILAIFCLSAFHLMVMYEALLWVIILFVVVYWANTAYNSFSIDENDKSVLSKGTRKILNLISTLSSLALFIMGALVFADYYFISIF